jgi:ClpP class serine protease
MFDVSSLLWLLIFIFLFYPQIQYRYLLRSRLNLIRKLSTSRNSNVISLIHRQEQLSFLGIPFYRYITIEDSEQVLRAIRSTPSNMAIDLILHTPGGLALAASQIAMALKNHPAETRVIIPHYAMSGGTLIAFAADKIIMDPHAVLGPVDPQIATKEGTVPAASIVKVAEEKKEKADDMTLIYADVAQKAINQMKEFIIYLTKDRVGEEKAKRIAEELVSGKFTHDYPITVEKLKELGLDVSTDVPKEIYELMDLYPQQVSQRSVEYIPVVPPQTR